MNKKYKKFMRESNAIEGEIRINPGDMIAVEIMLKGEITEASILSAHRVLGEYLNVDWNGKWRECEVRVGSYYPPMAFEVPGLMKKYFKSLPDMDSWEAHNEFANIHGFQDLNGRMSRLIWLNKAIDEGYDFSIPFLHKYYYQTLQHQNNR